MLFPLVILVLFEVCGRRVASATESERDIHDFYKRLYDFGLGKRAAYSYVSEYKRLPVYNFGLGKRSGGQGDAKPFSIGIGKRDYDLDDEYDDDIKDEYNKRMKQYSFGLGKRLPGKQYSFGLGKRPEGKMYSFGIGKRSPFTEYDMHNMIMGDYDYDSSEEKRSPPNGNGHRFSFGLGKRDPDREDNSRQGRSMHYNFGLGKRSETDQDKETTRSALVN